VRKDGKEIYLTRKEFLLLEYLMKNHGTVLSRGMILEHVWDMNADPFSNTIETHIMTLRRKIDSEQSLRLIRTVPGIGYKIDFS
jgi:two-component system OmpR family response regulator